MKKPMLIIEYDDRTAVILLNRRPTKAGLIHIRYEDDGSEQEVDAGQCKINLLTEA
jgi:ParB family chromosome partitioning protein